MNRKTFINSALRLLFLSMAAGLVLLLFRKGRISSGNSCDPGQTCSRCADFGRCTRNKALKIKGNEKG